MSPRIQKKQLSTMENVSILSDQELREALKRYNQNPGPITDSTREVYRKKLASLMEETNKEGTVEEELPEEDSSDDETYEVETDEEDTSEDETSEEETADDGIVEEEIAEDLKPKTGLSNRFKLNILLAVPLISYLIYYLYSPINYQFPIPHQLMRQLLIILVLSPFVYAIYKVVRYYMNSRYQEMQTVCNLVDKSLELLQSPDNPTGLMPILHIRDTLLTPVERKTAAKLWAKAVKFIEEHESRIKVELVSIDGEEFRAWKWIGSRKL